MEQVLKSPGFLSTSRQDCSPTTPHMRIADFLLLDQDKDDADAVDSESAMNGSRRRNHEGSCGFECLSPRRTISRWLNRAKEKKSAANAREREERGLGDGSANASSRVIPTRGEDESPVKVPGAGGDESGQYGNVGMFNLGAASSLLYLVGASNNELSKMEKLRKEMELLLQDVREKTKRRHSPRELSELTESVASCVTDIKEVLSCSSHLSEQSQGMLQHVQEQHECIFSSTSSRCESKQEVLEGIEQLEAELEAELDRLQLQLDAETPPKQSNLERMKISNKDFASAIGQNMSLGEVICVKEESTEVLGGVPPIELEIRLHELLEARQQERIDELEASLEALKRKLSEKEREVSWWKDTALVLSQHVPESSHHSLPLKPLIC